MAYFPKCTNVLSHTRSPFGRNKMQKIKFYASHKHNVLNIAIIWIHLKMNMLMNKHKTPSTRKVLVLYINHNVIRFYLLEQGFSSLLWGNETKYFVHVLPIQYLATWQHLETPSQYQNYKDILKRKVLTFYSSINYTIAWSTFLKSAQPPFGPICNLSQDKLVVFWEYNNYKNENPNKGFA